MKKLRKIACVFSALAIIWGLSGCSEDEEDVALEKISIQSFESEISLNNEYTVSPVFTPSDATNKNFTISVDSTASDWVTIDSTNKTIKPTQTGIFTLTVTSSENSSITDSKEITVKEIELTGLSIPSTYEFYVGRSTLVTPVFTPSDASYQNVEWTSSDENVATIDELGNVTGIKAGTVTITVTSQRNTSISAQLELTISPVMPESLSLKTSSLVVQKAGSANLVPIFTPSDTTEQSVTYSTSADGFTVSSDGIVTVAESVSTGTTGTITVTSVADSSKTTTASIKVIDGDTYIIDDTNTQYGFVSTTGSLKEKDTRYTGYSGSSYFENFSQGTTDNIVYSVCSATEQDVKALLHYAFWGGNGATVRGAYLVVNGAVSSDMIYLNYTSKNGSDNVKEFESDGVTPKSYHSIWEDSNEITIHLDSGENQIRVIPVPKDTEMPDAVYQIIAQQDSSGAYITPKDQGASSTKKAEGYLSNIDYLQLSGSGLGAGSNSLSFYSVTATGDFGTVECSPSQDFYKEGTELTLTATPKDGYKFDVWHGRTESGDFVSSAEESYTFTISDNVVVEAHFIPTSYSADSSMVGYATITDDLGSAAYTISGGAGGETIEISSLDDLTDNSNKISGNDPYIVKFTGSTRITTSDNKSIIQNVGSNKTIYGAEAGAGLKNIELRIEGDNVIVRNMIFGEVIAYDTLADYKGEGNDAMSINGGRHVWIDHCELRSNTTPLDNNGNKVSNSSDSDFEKDWYDGLLDIKNGATWVTVSNCYFHDHYKAVLCGSGDDGPDVNKDGYTDSDMRVTFYNNYWKNINARMPLFRYGKGHIYDSYFDAGTFSGSASCINVRAGSELYIEGNSFNGIKSDDYTIGFYYADSTKAYGNVSGTWVSKNNSNVSNNNGTSYKPPYSYTEPTGAVKEPTVGTDVGVGCSITLP